MGGGVVASLALRRPELLSGMILEAPMLYVSDDLKPPKIVLSLFRHVIIKIPGLVTWPVAPSKDIEERCFSDPETLLFERSNPLNFRSKPRLGSCVRACSKPVLLPLICFRCDRVHSHVR